MDVPPYPSQVAFLAYQPSQARVKECEHERTEGKASLSEEKVWDQELGCWVDVDLCALEKQVAEDAEKGEATATGDMGDIVDIGGGVDEAVRRTVADTEYYDLLRVQCAPPIVPVTGPRVREVNAS
eukprot:s450_g10.t3